MAEAASGWSSRSVRLSRYEVKRSIGKGSYGEVFLVTHKGDGKQVGKSALPQTYTAYRIPWEKHMCVVIRMMYSIFQ